MMAGGFGRQGFPRFGVADGKERILSVTSLVPSGIAHSNKGEHWRWECRWLARKRSGLPSAAGGAREFHRASQKCSQRPRFIEFEPATTAGTNIATIKTVLSLQNHQRRHALALPRVLVAQGIHENGIPN
jgi:hypothetical protein